MAFLRASNRPSAPVRATIIVAVVLTLAAALLALSGGSASTASASGAGSNGNSLCYGEILAPLQNSNAAAVVNEQSNLIETTIGVGSSPTTSAYSGDGRFAFVPNYTANSVSMISTETNTVLRTLTTVHAGYMVTSSFNGGVIFLATYDQPQGQNLIERIDTATGGITSSAPRTSYESDVILSPDETRLWTIEMGYPSNLMLEFDAQSLALLSSTPISEQPNLGGTMSLDGSKIYLTDSGGNDLPVFDTSTRLVSSLVPPSVINSVGALTLSRSGTTLFAAVDFPYRFVAINLATNTWSFGLQLDTVAQFNYLTGLAASADDSKVFVGASAYANGGLIVLDVATPNGGSLIPLEIYNSPVACPLTVDPDPPTPTTTATDPIPPVFSA